MHQLTMFVLEADDPPPSTGRSWVCDEKSDGFLLFNSLAAARAFARVQGRLLGAKVRPLEVTVAFKG